MLDGAEQFQKFHIKTIFRVLELLPLPITALLPVVLLPMMGIVSTEEISHYYMKVHK